MSEKDSLIILNHEDSYVQRRNWSDYPKQIREKERTFTSAEKKDIQERYEETRRKETQREDQTETRNLERRAS